MNGSDHTGRRARFPAARRALGPAHAGMHDEAVDRILREAYPGSHPDDVEAWFKSVGPALRRAAQNAAPRVAPLATQAMNLTPQGRALNLVAAGSGLLSQRPVQPTATGVPRPVARPAATPQVMARQSPTIAATVTASDPGQSSGQTLAGVDPQASDPAVASPQAHPDALPGDPLAQLRTLLTSPSTLRALSARALPSALRRPIQVGALAVPADAFIGAIAELAGQVADSAESAEELEVASYLLDESGMPRCDIYNPADRAALLLSELVLEATDVAGAPVGDYDQGNGETVDISDAPDLVSDEAGAYSVEDDLAGAQGLDDSYGLEVDEASGEDDHVGR